MKSVTLLEAEARAAAEAAFHAGGPSPYDSDGGCLLPTEPLEADWVGLADALGVDRGARRALLGELGDEDVAAFETIYRERMAELVPDRDDRAAVEAAWRTMERDRIVAWHARVGIDCAVFDSAEGVAEALTPKGGRP